MIDTRPAKRRQPAQVRLALVVSAVLHLLLLAWLSRVPWSATERERAVPVMAVEYLPDMAAIPGVGDPYQLPRQFIIPIPSEEEPEDETADEETLRPDPIHGQIVELPRPLRPERPDQADYLSEYDTKVPEETASTRFRVTSPVVAPKYSPTDLPGIEGTGAKDVQRPADGTAQRGDVRHAKRTPGNPGPSTPFLGPTAPSTGTGDDAGKPVDRGRSSYIPDLSSRYNLGKPERSSGSLGRVGGAGPSGVPGVLAAAQRGTGRPQGSPSNDWLPGEKKSDSTLLNSYEFKHAAFINKVKRLVSFYADQTIHNAQPRQPLTKASYALVIQAVLDAKGKLQSIVVSQSCGVPEFDDALAQAYRLAAPFPDPPSGMLGSDGHARLPDMGFVIELTHARAQMNGIDPRQGVMFPGLQTAPR